MWEFEFAYIDELEKWGEGDAWDVRVDKLGIKIAISEGSKYCDAVPMARAEIVLETCVTPEALYDLLYTPAHRLKWDSNSLKTFEIIDKGDISLIIYMQNKAPWPLKDRDFVERHVIRRSEEGDCIKVFSQACEEDSNHRP
jgi:hypothetical protein